METKPIGRIITEDLIKEAIELTRPMAIAILRAKDATWGPKMVCCEAEVFGIDVRVSFNFHAEDFENEKWKPEWKDPARYPRVAGKKLGLSMKYEMNTSTIIALYPALLKKGDFLYPGGAYRKGIGGCGTSGARGWADEAISEQFLTNVHMLVQREKTRRIQAEEVEI